MIGEAGLTTALHDAGYTLTERDPDYVVLGETRTYSFERITQAIRLIDAGARFIATNPDATGPTLDGPLPATGSVAALISRATGVEPYFVGKPNPLMMRSALNAIDAHSETAAMVGDRMDTDVVSGLEAGMETILVLTGVTTPRGGRAPPLPRLADRRLDRRPDCRARLARPTTRLVEKPAISSGNSTSLILRQDPVTAQLPKLPNSPKAIADRTNPVPYGLAGVEVRAHGIEDLNRGVLATGLEDA